MQQRPAILHISADFPDPVQPFKTPVIRDLLDLTADRFSHDVLSINRIGITASALVRILAGDSKQMAATAQPFAYGRALTYPAPPRGILHASMLYRLADQIAERIARDWHSSSDTPSRKPLLVGHKLTIEGLVVHRLARILGVPYALCLQGDTDAKIIAARPDLRRTFARVYREAAVVFPFTPWIHALVERRLGQRTGPVLDLPCPTELDQPVAPIVPGNGLVSVFHLKNARRKNLLGMARALTLPGVRDTVPGLTILGGGTEADRTRCATLVGDARIRFEGPVGRDTMVARLNGATGLVLPSLRESFGLVFVEALFAGIPVIYPAGQAVTGYFDGCPFALPVDPRDPVAIAKAMQHLTTHETKLKTALAQWQATPEAAQFRRSAIAARFSKGLDLAIAT